MASRPSLMPVDTALAQILSGLTCRAPEWLSPLPEAAGCVLVNDQVAPIDVPGHDNSAMDGYAVNRDDLSGATPTLVVSQTIAAGHPGTPLQPGTAARIFTGAPIPEGANAVVIQEDTRREGDRVTLLEIPEPGANIRLRGHDLKQGKRVLSAGQRLRPQDVGLLASLGIAAIAVRRPLTVAVVNTGDEVVAPGTELGAGQIHDSNSYVLAALLERLGFRVRQFGIIEDSLERTREVLATAARETDCVLTTGGVSVGDEDHVRQAVEALGALQIWKLAIKPGKPFTFGHIGETPFFGLPGNPVAVFVTTIILVRAALLKLQGAEDLRLPVVRVRADFARPVSATRQEYLRVRLEKNAAGDTVLTCFQDQGSSVLSSLSWADGLAVVPVGCEVKPGDELDYLPFDGVL